MKKYITIIALLILAGLTVEHLQGNKEILESLAFLISCLLLGVIISKKLIDFDPMVYLIVAIWIISITVFIWKLLNIRLPLLTCEVGAILSIMGLGYYRWRHNRLI
jgi:uncharacterized membrane protein YcaP (DUF421 family)